MILFIFTLNLVYIHTQILTPTSSNFVLIIVLPTSLFYLFLNFLVRVSCTNRDNQIVIQKTIKDYQTAIIRLHLMQVLFK